MRLDQQLETIIYIETKINDEDVVMRKAEKQDINQNGRIL